MPQLFGDILREARVAAFMTMRELADRMDWAPSYVSELENGNRLPPKEESVLKKLAKVLGVESNNFIEASNREREAKASSKEVRKFIASKGELAFSLMRAAEDMSDEDLEKMIRQAENRSKKRGEK